MGRGGKRNGAGRKPGSISRLKALAQATPEIKLIKGSAAHQAVTAATVLGTIDESSVWARLLSSKQEKVVLAAMQYLTDRRDGKAQQTVLHGNASSTPTRAKSVIESAISSVTQSPSDSTTRPN